MDVDEVCGYTNNSPDSIERGDLIVDIMLTPQSRMFEVTYIKGGDCYKEMLPYKLNSLVNWLSSQKDIKLISIYAINTLSK